jgi:hypothetical protein
MNCVAAGRRWLLPVWYDGYKDAVKTEVIVWIKKHSLRVAGVEFDIWILEKTWAFSNKLLKSNEKNLIKTVYLSVDGIAFNYTRKSCMIIFSGKQMTKEKSVLF